jgi:hypothetical protein
MPITLAEAKVGMVDKVNQAVADTFRRSSLLLDMLQFDNAVAPGTGGSTLTYGYLQLKTPSTAAKRTINSEYVAGEAIKEKKTADLAIIGGKFQIDRVIIDTAGSADELGFQAEQKIKATANLFHNLVINGKEATDGFDGLSELLKGTENEITSTTDISTGANMEANGQALLDELDALALSLDGKASAFLMNRDMLTKVRGIARRAGYYERTTDSFGNPVETFNGIPMINLEQFFNGSKSVDVIPTTSGKTDIYAVRIAQDGFHGISPTGTKIINSYMPDLTLPGAVKEGEVELVAGVVLKNTRAAAVLRGVTIKGA